MSTGLDEIAPAQRDALRALANGEGPADLAERCGRSPDEIVDLARQGLIALAGEPDGDLPPRERAAVADYLLGRQSPGQAEGTWRRLADSPEAAGWAQRMRGALVEAGAEDPPPLPGDDNALSPTDRAHRRRSRRAERDQSLGERRAERNRKRTAANAQQAAAEMASPFRSEAIEAHHEADDRIELPRWAPRPVQLTMYAVLVALIVGLAFAIVVRIPVNTNAVVLVSEVPPTVPGSEGGGLKVVALFPQANGQSKDTGSGEDVRVGDVLRVALPGEKNRTPMKLHWVSPNAIAPRQVIDDFKLPLGQANRVVAPGHVAIAPLRAPAGKRPGSYEGTTTTEASVQTGSRRIISLLF